MRTLQRDDWLPLARKLDWEFSYVTDREVYPDAVSGGPWLEHAAWKDWDEPYRTTYGDYVAGQHQKESAVTAVGVSVAQEERPDAQSRRAG
jgi:toluene monooxygenase system protein A